MINDLSRRDFLLRAGSGVSTLLLSAHWPAILSAAAHARESAQSSATPKLDFFSAEQAKEVDAITTRIIPADDMPGAHEAGAVYFMDRALTTFAVADQKTYRDGLLDLQTKVQKLFPSLARFSDATPAQQDEILHTFDQPIQSNRRAFRPGAGTATFFETIRTHTIIAFLIDPDSTGGTGIGWQVIGRERTHVFQPPFGYYDKDYAGWQPNSSDKSKA